MASLILVPLDIAFWVAAKVVTLSYYGIRWATTKKPTNEDDIQMEILKTLSSLKVDNDNLRQEIVQLRSCITSSVQREDVKDEHMPLYEQQVDRTGK